jgi:hypothetical protein
MKPYSPLAFFGVLWCAANPASALAQPNLLSQFVGTWSQNESACGLLQSGQIDRMSTADASNLGVIEISNTEINWPYNSGTTQCKFQSQSAAETAGGAVRVAAVCNYKGQATNESISLAITTSSKLALQFENGFWNDGKQVQLSKCVR